MYLLVREADVAPKSFVCAASEQAEFSGRNSGNVDIVELWDFGRDNYPAGGTTEGPVKCLSYAYQIPYAAGQTGMVSTGSKGKYAADARRSAAFAVMADKNPWFESKLIRGNLNSSNFMDHIGRLNAGNAPTNSDFSKVDRWGLMGANAYPHGREGQNVTYADGHNSWETRSDVSVKNDNIYTRWSTTAVDTTGVYNRIGGAVAAPLTDFAPLSGDDSVLVNDGPLTNP